MPDIATFGQIGQVVLSHAAGKSRVWETQPWSLPYLSPGNQLGTGVVRPGLSGHEARFRQCFRGRFSQNLIAARETGPPGCNVL
jgi:hypothetical protein